MDNDRVNQDGNLIGRLGAVACIIVAVVALGRVCGVTSAMCPMSSSKLCPFSAAPAAAPAPQK